MQTLARRRQAPQEEIDGAADVAIVVIVRQAYLEQAMQGQEIEDVLQLIAGVQDLGAHGLGGVGGGVGTEPVRLVVGDVVTALVGEDQVHEALEHAIEPRGLEGRARRAAEGMAADQPVDRLGIDAMGGEPELHLGDAGGQVGKADRDGWAVPQGRQAQGLADELSQPGRQGFDPGLPAPGLTPPGHRVAQPPGVGRDHREALGCYPFEQVVEEGAGLGPPREGMGRARRGRRSRAGRYLQKALLDRGLGRRPPPGLHLQEPFLGWGLGGGPGGTAIGIPTSLTLDIPARHAASQGAADGRVAGDPPGFPHHLSRGAGGTKAGRCRQGLEGPG